jgi:hypothetical protein
LRGNLITDEGFNKRVLLLWKEETEEVKNI